MIYASVRRHVLVTLAIATLVALLPLGAVTTAQAATAPTTAAAKTVAAKTVVKKTATKKKAKTPKQIARAIAVKKYKWKTTRQWTCLKKLWVRESGWRVHAGNPARAYGIPQALPGKKMGKGWRHSATAQIKWGLKYIDGRYGTPCGADSHQRRTGWY